MLYKFRLHAKMKKVIKLITNMYTLTVINIAKVYNSYIIIFPTEVIQLPLGPRSLNSYATY